MTSFATSASKITSRVIIVLRAWNRSQPITKNARCVNEFTWKASYVLIASISCTSRPAFAIASDLYRPFITAQGEHEFNRQKASLCKCDLQCDLKLSKAYFRSFYDGTHAILLHTRGIFTHHVISTEICIICIYHEHRSSRDTRVQNYINRFFTNCHISNVCVFPFHIIFNFETKYCKTN